MFPPPVPAEYTQIGTDEALPLGEEFQEHIRCFVKLSEKKITKQFALVGKIIQQLGSVVLVFLHFTTFPLRVILPLEIHLLPALPSPNKGKTPAS